MLTHWAWAFVVILHILGIAKHLVRAMYTKKYRALFFVRSCLINRYERNNPKILKRVGIQILTNTTMKKLLLMAVLLIAGATTMKAQDLLTKSTGEDVEVIVKEVDEDRVKYVLFSEPEGVVYTIPTSEVIIIRYASGRNEIFGQRKTNSLYDNGYGGGNLIGHGMKYKELKDIYDFREWHGGYEKYSPLWCGVGSLFIPGLGQICCGEWGRGLGFVGINVLNNLLSATATTYESALIYTLTGIGVCVWSVIDATRVAKVKNMYETDLRSQYSEVSVDFYPSLNPIFQSGDVGVAPGMTLSITF